MFSTCRGNSEVKNGHVIESASICRYNATCVATWKAAGDFFQLTIDILKETAYVPCQVQRVANRGVREWM